MNKKILVDLKNVSKEYSVGSGRNISQHRVLDNISFKLKRGDRIGLIGDNGVGKTTLFKIMAGITKASKGVVKRNGKIVTLMNLEDGFDLELSGRENIMINGLLMGMEMREVKEKISKIIDFSGIGEYIDNPFFTYSSGMKFRLAFAVAIASECDVLIMDEIFMVGDFNYQSKVLEEIKSFGKSRPDVSLIISSHMPAFLLTLVNKCYEIRNGKLYDVEMKSLAEIVRKRDNEYTSLLLDSDLLRQK